MDSSLLNSIVPKCGSTSGRETTEAVPETEGLVNRHRSQNPGLELQQLVEAKLGAAQRVLAGSLEGVVSLVAERASLLSQLEAQARNLKLQKESRRLSARCPLTGASDTAAAPEPQGFGFTPVVPFEPAVEVCDIVSSEELPGPGPELAEYSVPLSGSFGCAPALPEAPLPEQKLGQKALPTERSSSISTPLQTVIEQIRPVGVENHDSSRPAPADAKRGCRLSSGSVGSGKDAGSLGDAMEFRASITSSDAGCHQFEVLPLWVIRKENGGKNEQRRASLRKMSVLMFDSSALAQDVMTQRQNSNEFRWLQPFLVHPNSVKRAFWDTASFVLLLYDMLMIPFQMFDPSPNSFFDLMVWLTRLFWTFDMFLSCITGHLASDGSIEMRHPQILKRYCRRWFLLDFALVLIDWMELMTADSATVGFARLGKASRGFRILRMLRLLRLLRMQQVVQLIDERIRSDRLMICADIVKIVMIIVGCAHFAACAWYGIGSRDAAFTWVKTFLQRSDGVMTRYWLSLHWSLSQFTGGMDEVVPQNLLERIFAVCLWIIGFMLAAVLVSSLTSEITRLQIISNQHSQQLSTLRRFLVDHNVSSRLAVRVQRNARHALQEMQRNMQEENVELLRLVSEPLRMELHFEIFSPILATHPFFRQYIDECPHVMRKVCHKCTAIVPAFAGDVIFNPGETPNPPKMYFVMSGLLEYFTIGGHQILVKESQWIAEATLWTIWSHRGGLRARTDSQLCEVNAREFQKISGEFDHTLWDPRSYATNFVNLLNTYEGGVTDLPMPKQVLEEACGIKNKRGSRSSIGGTKVEPKPLRAISEGAETDSD